MDVGLQHTVIIEPIWLHNDWTISKLVLIQRGDVLTSADVRMSWAICNGTISTVSIVIYYDLRMGGSHHKNTAASEIKSLLKFVFLEPIVIAIY